MSYSKGELRHGVVLTDLEWEIADDRWIDNPSTAGDQPDRMLRDGYSGLRHGQTVVWLPHRCDEWDIGGVDDAKRLLADLEAAISEAEK